MTDTFVATVHFTPGANSVPTCHIISPRGELQRSFWHGFDWANDTFEHWLYKEIARVFGRENPHGATTKYASRNAPVTGVIVYEIDYDRL